MSTSVAPRRRDLHNASINFAEAIAGRCGFTHVASGRVCHLPERHAGPCDLRYLAPPATATPSPSPKATDHWRRRSHDETPSTYEEHS
jgi:hypothetical protein